MGLRSQFMAEPGDIVALEVHMGMQSLCRAAVAASVAIAAIGVPLTASAQILVRGVLYDDETGAPLTGTVMLVDPGRDAPVAYSATDSLGQFSLRADHGVYQIAAIRPGYTSVLSVPVTFEAGEQLTIRIPIAVSGDPQHRIGVVERLRAGQGTNRLLESSRRASMRDEALRVRRKLGTGLQYDRTQIERATVGTLGEFLMTVPGLHVTDPMTTGSMEMTRSRGMAELASRTGQPCRIGWFMDGHRIDLPGRSDPLTDGLARMPLSEIDVIEVFRGLSEMPAEFAEPDLRCGAVAIWTR